MPPGYATIIVLTSLVLVGACDSVEPLDPSRGMLEATGPVSRSAAVGDSIIIEVAVVDTATRQVIPNAEVAFQVVNVTGVVSDTMQFPATNRFGVTSTRIQVDTVAGLSRLRAFYRHGQQLSTVEFTIHGSAGPPARAVRAATAVAVGETIRIADLFVDRFGNADSTFVVPITSLAPSIVVVEGNLLRGIARGAGDLRATLGSTTVTIRAHALTMETYPWTEVGTPWEISGSSARRLLVAWYRTYRLAGSTWLPEGGLPEVVPPNGTVASVVARDGTAWSISNNDGARTLWQSPSEGVWVNATSMANGQVPQKVFSTREGPVLLSCDASRAEGILRRLVGDGSRYYPDPIACDLRMILGAPTEIVRLLGSFVTVWDGAQWRIDQPVPVPGWRYTESGGGAGPNGGAHWSETACPGSCTAYQYARRVVRFDRSVASSNIPRVTAISGSVGSYDSTKTWIAVTSDTGTRAVARSESATRIWHELLGDLPVTRGRWIEAGPWVDFDNVMWYVDRVGPTVRIVRVDLP